MHGFNWVAALCKYSMTASIVYPRSVAYRYVLLMANWNFLSWMLIIWFSDISQLIVPYNHIYNAYGLLIIILSNTSHETSFFDLTVYPWHMDHTWISVDWQPGCCVGLCATSEGVTSCAQKRRQKGCKGRSGRSWQMASRNDCSFLTQSKVLWEPQSKFLHFFLFASFFYAELAAGKHQLTQFYHKIPIKLFAISMHLILFLSILQLKHCSGKIKVHLRKSVLFTSFIT